MDGEQRATPNPNVRPAPHGATSATTRTKTSKWEESKWLWHSVVIQLVISELTGLVNAIAAILILVKAGILQLATCQ
jgi:hypothetical protein